MFKNPHNTLKKLVTLNAAFDIVAAATWLALPATRAKLNLDFTVVTAEALAAAFLFALTAYGLQKNKPWAALLAIALPVVQRVFGIYVFFPSTAIAATLAWSSLIIYLAIGDRKRY